MDQKKITAISGPSGGGKTTLLRLLINFISPDSGEILYKDKPLESYSPEVIRKKIKNVRPAANNVWGNHSRRI